MYLRFASSIITVSSCRTFCNGAYQWENKVLKSKIPSRSCGLRIWLSARRFISPCTDLPRFGATASSQSFHETDSRSLYEGEIREVLVSGLWTGVEGLDEFYEECEASGAKRLQEPTNNPWTYEIQVEDLDRQVLRIPTERQE